MDSRLVSVFWLLWLVLLWISMSLFEYLCPFECIARSSMTGSYGKLCLTLWGADKLFHSGAPLTIPTSNAEGLCFSTSWPTLVLSFFWATLGVKWYLLILLICISLMTDGTEHLYVTFQKVNPDHVSGNPSLASPFTLGIRPSLLPLAVKPFPISSCLPFLP